jgi:hypothetical protein
MLNMHTTATFTWSVRSSPFFSAEATSRRSRFEQNTKHYLSSRSLRSLHNCVYLCFGASWTSAVHIRTRNHGTKCPIINWTKLSDDVIQIYPSYNRHFIELATSLAYSWKTACEVISSYSVSPLITVSCGRSASRAGIF